MSKKTILACAITLVCIGWPVSLYFAYKQGRTDVLASELKVYYLNLKYRRDAVGANRQLYEFLKGRYYSVAAGASDRLLLTHTIDPGPITNEILGKLVIGKSGESPTSLYGIFSDRTRERQDRN